MIVINSLKEPEMKQKLATSSRLALEGIGSVHHG